MAINFNKILIGGALVAALLLWAALFSGRLLFAPEQTTPSPDETLLPKQVSFRGTYVCLPHKNSGGPQTLECALGMQADDGNHYALSLAQFDAVADIQTGERIEATGLLVPIEAISSDHWFKYDIRGIMQVSSLKKL